MAVAPSFLSRSQAADTTSGREGAALIGTDAKANLGGATSVEAALTSINTQLGELAGNSNTFLETLAPGDPFEIVGIYGIESARSGDRYYLRISATGEVIQASQVGGLEAFIQSTIGVSLIEGPNIEIDYDAETGETTISGTATGVTDHGALTGLSDDDHTQYLKTDGSRALTGDQSAGTHKITNLATPTNTGDAATKGYVDSIAGGTIDFKGSCRVATTGVLTLSGEQTIDGISVVSGDRVLVKNQSTASQNGIYVCNSSAWSRAADADSSAEVTGGMYVFVNEGSTNGDTAWVLVTNDTITLGTTGLVFVQFGASITDHGALSGLSDDDHSLYALANGHRWTTTPTASRAVISDASGYLVVSTVTAAELNTLSGISTASSLFTQLGNKTDVGHAHNAGDISSGQLANARLGAGGSTWSNGQLLIGNGSNGTGTVATLTGTANQITFTNGAGSITGSLPQSIGTSSNPQFATLSLSANTSQHLSIINTTNDDNPPGILLQKSKSGNVADGTGLARIRAQGFYTGSSYTNAGEIAFEVDGSPGSGDMPSRMIVRLSPDGSSTLTSRLEVRENGAVLIGTSTKPTTTGPVIVLGDYGGNPTLGANTPGIFSKEVSSTKEICVIDSAGNVTQLSDHAHDAPAWFYDDEDPLPRVSKEENVYLGIVRYTNRSRADMLDELRDQGLSLPCDPQKLKRVYTETFAEHFSRTGVLLQQLDWNAVQQSTRDRDLSTLAAWQAAKDAADLAIAEHQASLAYVEIPGPEPEPHLAPEPAVHEITDPPAWLATRLAAQQQE